MGCSLVLSWTSLHCLGTMLAFPRELQNGKRNSPSGLPGVLDSSSKYQMQWPVTRRARLCVCAAQIKELGKTPVLHSVWSLVAQIGLPPSRQESALVLVVSPVPCCCCCQQQNLASNCSVMGTLNFIHIMSGFLLSKT